MSQNLARTASDQYLAVRASVYEARFAPPFLLSIPAPAERVVALGDDQLQMTIEPVWSIASRTVASLVARASPRSQAHGARAGSARPRSLGERLNVVAEILTFAGTLMPKPGRDGAQLALHVPVDYSLVETPAGREAFLGLLQGNTHPGVVVCELIGLPVQADPAANAEVVDVLRSRCKAVIARHPGDGLPPSSWNDADLSAVTFDFSGETSANSPDALTAAGAAADGLAVALIGYGLKSHSEVLSAWAAGFTHVSGPVISAGVLSNSLSEKLSPRDLYATAARSR